LDERAVNIERFRSLLVSSQLFGEGEASELADNFRSTYRDSGEEASAEHFSDFVVATERLTQWQCDKLRMGKYKGFYLDNFVLLSQVGKGSDYASYLARNARDGKLVTLYVTPVAITGGAIKYRIEPYAGS
jgi:hypothetical protein